MRKAALLNATLLKAGSKNLYPRNEALHDELMAWQPLVLSSIITYVRCTHKSTNIQISIETVLELQTYVFIFWCVCVLLSLSFD